MEKKSMKTHPHFISRGGEIQKSSNLHISPATCCRVVGHHCSLSSSSFTTILVLVSVVMFGLTSGLAISWVLVSFY